jgi:hypothetical protein
MQTSYCTGSRVEGKTGLRKMALKTNGRKLLFAKQASEITTVVNVPIGLHNIKPRKISVLKLHGGDFRK